MFPKHAITTAMWKESGNVVSENKQNNNDPLVL